MGSVTLILILLSWPIFAALALAVLARSLLTYAESTLVLIVTMHLMVGTILIAARMLTL